ncbi:MAG: YwiC-like family protein [Vicinamibacterales bacterium]
MPVEHGGWGFLFEPIVMALVAVPSAATVLLALTAFALFLSRQPLKVAIEDTRRRRRVPRTKAAWAIALGYLLVAGAGVGSAVMVAPYPFWAVAALLAPLGFVTLWFDARGESRNLIPELAGATALAGLACAAGLAAGLTWPLALSFWVSALVRVVPAIVTVRERVQRLHGEAPRTFGPAASHALALSVAAGLALSGLMPPAVGVIALLLALRAAWELRPAAPATTAMRIGIRELVTGLVAAAAIGLAWRLA